MHFLVDMIKGIFVGVANVIPGVSGGTMAVSFGIYDRLLSSISDLFKDIKKSIKTLLPIGIGMALGIAGFTFILGWLLENHPFVTSMSFTGLILGGLPIIISELKTGWQRDTKKSIAVNVVLFLLFAAFALCLLFANGSSDSGLLLAVSPAMLFKVFFMGVIASATMIIPGVSGSLVLMILGYYFGIIQSIKDFISALRHMDMAVLIDRTLILAPFALGCIAGIFLLSKLIKWLFENFASATYSAILALVVTSPVSIFVKVNEEYALKGTGITDIILGVILLLGCMCITIFMSRLETAPAEE